MRNTLALFIGFCGLVSLTERLASPAEPAQTVVFDEEAETGVEVVYSIQTSPQNDQTLWLADGVPVMVIDPITTNLVPYRGQTLQHTWLTEGMHRMEWTNGVDVLVTTPVPLFTSNLLFNGNLSELNSGTLAFDGGNISVGMLTNVSGGSELSIRGGSFVHTNGRLMVEPLNILRFDEASSIVQLDQLEVAHHGEIQYTGQTVKAVPVNGATFRLDSILGLSQLTVAPGTYPLVVSQTPIVNEGLQLSVPDMGWSFSVVGNTLQGTFLGIQ